MEPKVFDDLDEMEDWAENRPAEVTRHLLEAWEEIIEGNEEIITISACRPEVYFEDLNIVVEEHEDEEALEQLLEESVEREDYEAAQRIKELQSKL